MASNAKQPRVTAAELKAAFDDWKKKDRHFIKLVHGKREPLESEIDSAGSAVSDAFDVAYKLILRATGARDNQACVAILPDGSQLIAVGDPGDQIGDESAKFQLVPATRVVRLA